MRALAHILPLPSPDSPGALTLPGHTLRWTPSGDLTLVVSSPDGTPQQDENLDPAELVLQPSRHTERPPASFMHRLLRRDPAPRHWLHIELRTRRLRLRVKARAPSPLPDALPVLPLGEATPTDFTTLSQLLAVLDAHGARAALPATPGAHANPRSPNDGPPPTLAHAVFERAASHGDDVALTTAQDRWSWSTLARTSNAIAHHLHSLSLPPGSRVALLATPSLNDIVALLACSAAGLSFAPLLPNADSETLQRQLELLAPEVLITDGANAGVRIPSRCRGDRLISVSRLPNAKTWRGIVRSRYGDPWLELDATDGEHVEGLALFTGGTTGEPRLVCHTRASVAAAYHDIATRHAMRREETSLVMGSPGHAFTLGHAVGAPLLVGASLHHVPDAASALNTSARADIVCAPASFWRRLRVLLTVESARMRPWTRGLGSKRGMKRMRVALSSLEPLAESTRAFYGGHGVDLSEVFGSTEDLFVCATRPVSAPRYRAVPGVRVDVRRGVLVCSEHGLFSRNGEALGHFGSVDGEDGFDLQGRVVHALELDGSRRDADRIRRAARDDLFVEDALVAGNRSINALLVRAREGLAWPADASPKTLVNARLDVHERLTDYAWCEPEALLYTATGQLRVQASRDALRERLYKLERYGR